MGHRCFRVLQGEPGSDDGLIRGLRRGCAQILPADGLRRAIGEAHRRDTRRVNSREQWRGHLWQGRFASFVLDEPDLLACARYVELNPVRARLTASPSKYRWGSASAHVKRKSGSVQ